MRAGFLARVASGVFVVALVSSSTAIADTGFLDRAVTLSGATYRYQVYVPIEWSHSQSWPVMLYLHGAGQQGSDGLRHTTSRGAPGLIDAIRSERARFPMIVIFPQAPDGTRWGTPRTEEMVLAELDATTKEFNGDANRVYLTGFSMGGQGVVRIASRWPTRFAALVAVAPRVLSGGATANPAQVAEDVQTHPFLAAPDPFQAFAQIVAQLPIQIYHGDADSQVPVEESRKLFAALKQVGAPDAHYTEIPGADHVPTSERAFSERELFSWLLAQRRQNAPH